MVRVLEQVKSKNEKSSQRPTTRPTYLPTPWPASLGPLPRHKPPPILACCPIALKVVSTAKRAGTTSVTGDETGSACASAATSAVSGTPPQEESPRLPAPPPRFKFEPPHHCARKTRCEGPAPPAPPSGGPVSRGGVGASVVWPDEEDLSRLEELD